MKKGQVYEGVIESVDFPNKGKIRLTEEEDRSCEKRTCGTESSVF